MANKVAWFEVVGSDGQQLRDFYGQIFGWNSRWATTRRWTTG